MKKFLVALLGLSAGLGGRVATQGFPELAVEQIALTTIHQCEGAIDESTPLCSDFVLMDIDGAHWIPIPGSERPAWSPDGTKLLVGNGEIFVITATGAIGVNLTNHPAYDTRPA